MASIETPKQAKERAAALKAIEQSEARIAQLVAQSAGKEGEALAKLEAQVKAEERKQALQEKEIARLDKRKALYDDIAGSLQTSVKLIEQTNKQTKNLFKSTATVESIEAQIVENNKKLAKAKLDGLRGDVRDLKAAQQKLTRQREIVSYQETMKKQLAVANDLAQEYAGTLAGFVNKLPGGKHLSKALGIDKLGEQIEVAMTKGIMAFQTAGGGIKGIIAGVRAFSGGILAALGPLALVAIAVGGLVALFTDISHKAHDISKETGLTYGQSKQLLKSSMKVQTSFGNQLSTTKDIVAVQTELLGQFGTMAMVSAEQAAQVAEIGNAFGYGATQAAKVNAAFMQMGMAADEASKAQTAVAAEALKAGVNVGAVTKDIAENAGATAKFFGGNVKALKKAAIEAAKMGVSLATMAKVSDSLLDFESSIASQFEFQALTGKQINLDLARQLALEGDIAGATKEVLSNVGSVSEFNDMDYLARKKLAEATGMEVDELQKSLIIQERLGDLTEEQAAAMSGLNISAEELSKLNADQIKSKLAEADAQKKMNASFESMTNELKTALLPLAESLVKTFAAVSPILKIAFTPLKWAAQFLQMIIGYAKEYQGILITIGSILGLHVANKKIQAAIDATRGATNARELVQLKLKAFFENNSVMKALSLQGIKSAILGTEQATNATKKSGLLLGIRDIATSAAQGAMKLAGAVAGIFSSFAQIPFGLGITLAAAAAAGMFKLYKSAQAKKTGDLAMGANGGPIVASPREGTIFQGTINDEIAMGPGVIARARGEAETARSSAVNVVSDQAITQATLKVLQDIKALLSRPSEQDIVLQVDGQKLGRAIRTADSFRRG